MLVQAVDDQQTVGFKLGYPESPTRFYSWLGGVHTDYRKQGVGKELMRQQHAECQQAGFRKIRMKTTNRWRAMLLLSISQGFCIVSTYIDKEGELKIILEKKLSG